MTTSLELEDSRARAQAIDLSQNILLTAPAGSGKTGLLTLRALNALAHCESPEGLLSITFTNKAAAEMRRRIHEALLDAAHHPQPDDEYCIQRHRLATAVLRRSAERGWDLLENPGRIRALTMDTLTRQIIAVAPVTSGLGGQPPIHDRPAALYADAVRRLMSELESGDPEAALAKDLAAALKLAEGRTSRLEETLATMLATRDQWLSMVGVDPEVISREVADAIRGHWLSRLNAFLEVLGPTADALAEALSMGNKNDPAFHCKTWPGADQLGLGRALSQLLVTKTGTIRKAFDAKTGFPAGSPANSAIKQAMAEATESWGDRADEVAQWLHFMATAPLPDALEQTHFDSLAGTARLLHRLATVDLQASFDALGGVDFTEITLRALSVLATDAGSASILARIDGTVQHILVDEAQDTSATQYALIHLMTQDWQPGDGNSLFMVGDPQQSIYAFRQADVALFESLRQNGRFHQTRLTTLRLTRNFRSDPGVVNWFNEAFARVFPKQADLAVGAVTFHPSIPNRPATGGGVHLKVVGGDPKMAEAQAVLERIKDTLKNTDRKIAVLARSRPHLDTLLPLLRQEGMEFASSDIDLVLDTDVVKDAVALIRALWHPLDRAAWVGLLRSPPIALSWEALTVLLEGKPRASVELLLRESKSNSERTERLLQALDRTSLMDLPARVEAVWESLGYPLALTRVESQDVARVFDALRQHWDTAKNPDLEDFQQGLLRLFAGSQSSRIEIMTLHKSKGLEFDEVILMGFWRRDQSTHPASLLYRKTPLGALMAGDGADEDSEHQRLRDMIHGLNTAAEAAETARLLYVAVTRARDQLYVIVPVKESKSGFMPADSGELMALLWPVIGADCTTPTLIAESSEETRWLMPATWEMPSQAEPKPVFTPLLRQTLRPSEAVLGSKDITEAEADSGVEAVVGTLFHQTIEFLLKGRRDWGAAVRDRVKGSLRAGMERMAVPSTLLDSSVDDILHMVDHFYHDPVAQRAIASPTLLSEYRLNGFVEGQWVNASLDLVTEEDGTLVVTDFKTGGKGLSREATLAYVSAATTNYTPQLENYRKLLQLQRGKPVRARLYFARSGDWREVA